MGGLAHYIEDEGVPTTQISLIREHTVIIVPPRALWVSFELGRPLGAPGDAAFQTRVLTAAIKLLDAPSGPVLEDYPEDAPQVEGPATLVCPVSFSVPEEERSDIAILSSKFMEEIAMMRPWYDISMSNSRRTTVGVSGMEPENIGSYVARFLDGEIPESGNEDYSSADLLKLAVEDLKAFYFEAATAQPGQATADSDTLSAWFWRETVAGRVMFAVRSAHSHSQDARLRVVVTRQLAPRAHAQYSPFEAKR